MLTFLEDTYLRQRMCMFFFLFVYFLQSCVCTHLTIHARWGSLLHSSIWSLWLRGHSWLRRCRWGRSNAVRGSWTLLCCNCWGSYTNGTQTHRRSEETQMPDIETRQLNKINFQRQHLNFISTWGLVLAQAKRGDDILVDLILVF